MNTPLFSDKFAEIFSNEFDEFCNEFENEFKKHSLPAPQGTKTRNRKITLADSEVISILIAFQGGQFRNFKHFYCSYVCHHLRDCFPNLVSYNRFIELSPRCAVPFMKFLHHCCRGECKGISFIILQFYGYVITKESNAIKYLVVPQKVIFKFGT